MSTFSRRFASRLRLYSLAPILASAIWGCPLRRVLSPFPTWTAGAEGGLLGSDFGIGLRSHYLPANSAIGITGGLQKYFPEAGSAYGGWVGARLDLDSGGALRPYGFAGATFLRSGYGGDDYEYDGSEFGPGGGAFRQDFGGDSQTAYGVRLGVGVQGNNPASKWSPFAEVGYDIFMGGAEFDNKATLSGGISYRLGGDSQ